MNPQNSNDYKIIKRVGTWSTSLLWTQIVLLPLVVLYPYLLNQKTITVKEFLLTAAVNIGMITLLIVMLVIKGEVLKQPENIPVRQISRNADWLAASILIVAIISLANHGRFGILWALFIIMIVQARQVAKKLERTGVQYASNMA